jgi:malate permease and related proteins
MSLAITTLNQILIMFLIILIGFICYKTKLIDKEGNKKISNILLMLVNPLLILVSYQMDFSSKLLYGLLISFFLAIITHILGIFISYVILRGKENPDVVIERFSSIYSNCGFMGIPLIYGIFGSEGVFYITAYMTVFNFFIWTHGLIMMIGKQDSKTMIKAILSPTIVAIFIGFMLFILRIKLPNVIFKSLDYVASMNTPLAMLIAGVTIAQSDILKVFLKKRIYMVIFLKQLLIPTLVLIIYSRFPLSDAVLTTAVLAAACPTAATGTLFALRYDKNALYASELFAMTTVFSIITLPIIMTLTGLIIK